MLKVNENGGVTIDGVVLTPAQVQEIKEAMPMRRTGWWLDPSRVAPGPPSQKAVYLGETVNLRSNGLAAGSSHGEIVNATNNSNVIFWGTR